MSTQSSEKVKSSSLGDTIRSVRERWQALLAAGSRHPLWIWLGRVWRGFFDHRCLVNASALTYSTMLAVVPLIAVVLAALKAAGFGDALRPFLLDQFPVLDPGTVNALLEYIDRANAQAVGTVGFAVLLVSCVTMLGTVESSLNYIFGVRAQRGYLRRAGDYLSMLIAGALMVALSIAGRTILQSDTLIERIFGGQVISGLTGLVLVLVPWVTAWLAFFLLYTWMPNKTVSWRAALFGALVGGTLFQLVQLGYIELQLGFSRYHAVYGALAQLPILLVWVYLSWVVVLIGAEGIAARSALSERALDPGELTPDLLAVGALREVVDAFDRGQPTPGAEELAVRLDVSVLELRKAVEPLLRAGILVEPDAEGGYLPAANPATISLESVLQALR